MHRWDDRHVDHVSFSAPFSHEGTDGLGAGADLLDSIGRRLSSRGYGFARLGASDYAQDFEVSGSGGVIRGMLGLADDEDREWLLFLSTKDGWLSRLLRTANVPISREIAKAIHEVLAEDQMFSRIRWYTAHGWNHAPSSAWRSRPDA